MMVHDSMYPSNAPLGADICTGGPGYRAWVTGIQFHDAFGKMELEQMMTIDAHATHGCELIDTPIDATEYIAAGSTRMDWCPRSSLCKREGYPA